MTITLPKPAANYVEATNNHDANAFINCFAPDAIVNDAGRTLRGIDAIREWSEKDVIAPFVTLEVLNVVDNHSSMSVETKVDGQYDKTGLPNPLILVHHMVIEGEKISELTIEFPK